MCVQGKKTLDRMMNLEVIEKVSLDRLLEWKSTRQIFQRESGQASGNMELNSSSLVLINCYQIVRYSLRHWILDMSIVALLLSLIYIAFHQLLFCCWQENMAISDFLLKSLKGI